MTIKLEMDRQKLLDAIETSMRCTKTSSTRFGRDAVGDPNFVDTLRRGRKPREATVRRVIAYIEERLND